MADPVLFCPYDEPEEIGGNLSKWASEIVQFRNIDVNYPQADFHEAMLYTKDLIEGACGLRIEIKEAGGANVFFFIVRIDGPGGVLARQRLPGRPSHPHENLRGEFDRADNRDQRTLNEVAFHEAGGHALGLGHVPESVARSKMNPRLNFDFVGKVDGWTRDQLQMRYGVPEDRPTDPVDFDVQSFMRQWMQAGIDIIDGQVSATIGN